MNPLIVGIGSTGCEHLKNLATMGFATEKGVLTVWDDNIVKLSHLHRNVFYKKEDIAI